MQFTGELVKLEECDPAGQDSELLTNVQVLPIPLVSKPHFEVQVDLNLEKPWEHKPSSSSHILGESIRLPTEHRKKKRWSQFY